VATRQAETVVTHRAENRGNPPADILR